MWVTNPNNPNPLKITIRKPNYQRWLQRLQRTGPHQMISSMPRLFSHQQATLHETSPPRVDPFVARASAKRLGSCVEPAAEE
ncbi:hypothetical protein V6N13_077041 [Hibiscus sabdariffa]